MKKWKKKKRTPTYPPYPGCTAIALCLFREIKINSPCARRFPRKHRSIRSSRKKWRHRWIIRWVTKSLQANVSAQVVTSSKKTTTKQYLFPHAPIPLRQMADRNFEGPSHATSSSSKPSLCECFCWSFSKFFLGKLPIFLQQNALKTGDWWSTPLSWN